MTDSNNPTAAALIRWANTSFEHLDTKVESLADLSDGLVLSRMLEEIDPEFAVQNLDTNPSSSKWVVKKQNLEAVYKKLQRYVRTHCVDDTVNNTALEAVIDFNAIAEHEDAGETTKFLKVFLVAAINGNNAPKFLQVITEGKLPDDVCMVIKEIISPPSNEEESRPETKGDALSLEAIRAENTALQKKNGDLATRLEHLQFSYDELLEYGRTKDERIDELLKLQNEKPDDHIKYLRAQLLERDNLIATQEGQIEDDRIKIERQTRELRERPDPEQVQKLEDRAKELQIQNEDLFQKSKILDNFKKKLEKQNNVTQENTELRQQIDILNDNQRDFDKVHEENETLQATITQYRKQAASYEKQVVEMGSQKKLLQEEIRQRDARIQNLLEGKAHDEEFIQNLHEQMRTSSPKLASPPSPSAKVSHLTLEEELAQSSDSTPNHALEISRLQAENQLLKSQLGGTTAANLRIELDELDAVRKRLESNYRDLQEENILAQHQLSALMSRVEAEKLVTAEALQNKVGVMKMLTIDFYRDETIAVTRKLYMETLFELNQVKAKLTEVQTELSSRDRELLQAKADLSAIDQDELDALEDLKATNEIITSSLQNDLLLLQNKFKALMTDHEQQKSHLVDALIAKDALSKEAAELKANGGTGTTTTGPQKTAEVSTRFKIPGNSAQKSGPVTQESEDAELARELAALGNAPAGLHDSFASPSLAAITTARLGSIRSSRASSISSATSPLSSSSGLFISPPPQATQFEKQEKIILGLQIRLKAAEEGGADAQKAAKDAIIKNLSRENALISSAWYDLTGRLQSNHLVLQRRQDAPKSWLNKQRQMVNTIPRR
ncbi:hypothetical protein HYFRA_00008601 [Hymenoscyphus fraxineus]|uniref:HOOK N-terminal domain-containing protein n=1 Tax=Hymenoscyphus fraxineus TaxID=746836 RepID=A0A9N9KYI1_9HELO|nr:hypothetical protein HYFRA_00008601 [Hymenoscyphus fraxineus]